ncbi:recombinase family protein [Thiomicrospira sp. R3]|uniref:recombinase family protein n=1 Tax=Thiomicrospira sp. R3 TaxID=3035472 RepID=UPI00259BEDAC|nr:recombinase family protein [Thiomicrospira sp. R3]WFE68098.1 recombinase family protein [Thiomicrospira sp. R3]
MKIGYARVSTLHQDLSLQLDALNLAGCELIYQETGSGSKSDRPELMNLLKAIRPGDELVVWKLDRLSRSLKDLINLINELESKSVGFMSITDHIDTTTPAGKLMFHIFGALAEFERNIIKERTMAGLNAAKSRGRLGGRPKKLTPKQIQMAKSILNNSNNKSSVEEVAHQFGVSRSTLFRALSE